VTLLPRVGPDGCAPAVRLAAGPMAARPGDAAGARTVPARPRPTDRTAREDPR
jgi:hypothetical protein